MKKINLKCLIIFFCCMGILISVPSIVYLFRNGGNINEYSGQNYYFIGQNSFYQTILGIAIFAVVVILSYIFYIFIIKKSNEFKNIKTILLIVFLIGLMFLICLPNTTTDIFYYMGTGRLFQEYGQNPYYVTVEDFLADTKTEDSILERTGYWADTVVLYGPLWTIICAFFSLLSFGNCTFLLYIYKFVSLGIHIATCYIIYKITNRKKFALIYGLNPFLLFEFLINVHNDIYLIFFVMLGIYFLKKKNNIWLCLISIIFSILIKYVTAIILPFLVLYYLRDKAKLKKLLYCILYAVFVIAIVLAVYMLFFDNIVDLFSILGSQQRKIKESIYLNLMLLNLDDLITPINVACIIIFACCMILYICLGFFKKKKFSNYMEYVKNLFFILIFGILTNFTAWYLSWLFIPLYWLKPKTIRSILFLQFLYMCSYIYLCFLHSDGYIYEAKILPVVILVMIVREIIIIIKSKKLGGNIFCKKMKNIL